MIAVLYETDSDQLGGCGKQIMYVDETSFDRSMRYIEELRLGLSSVSALSADLFVKEDGASRHLQHYDFTELNNLRN